LELGLSDKLKAHHFLAWIDGKICSVNSLVGENMQTCIVRHQMLDLRPRKFHSTALVPFAIRPLKKLEFAARSIPIDPHGRNRNS